MSTDIRHQHRVSWLEGFLVLVTAGLVLQLVPSSFWMSVLEWRPTWWVTTNLLFGLGLTGLEYTSDRKCGWLKALVGLAWLTLVLQLFPSLRYGLFGLLGTFLTWSLTTIPFALGKLWQTFLGAVDVRQWSRTTWFVANVLFVVVVIGIWAAQRLDLKQAWRERRERLGAQREEQERIRHAKESRKTREEIEAGRRRRRY
jgi:hypothetical protein